ncbi:MAG: efflux RND transporter periplasmic adaptor subunit [Thermodesulfovibrionales bacterium]|nr:efflux RND transporter periplasmic adaptor subunit [Thermodesulfovibrionales bacterium]
MEWKSPEDDVIKTLGMDRPSDRKRRLLRWLMAVFGVSALVAVAVAFIYKNNSNTALYVTQKAERGNMVVTVTATGRLEPVNQVDVGTEVSGIIKTVEAAHNNRVKAGQVLARLDTDTLAAQVAQSHAALKSAEARLFEAQATVHEKGNEMERSKRARELSGGKIPSQRDIDAAEAALRRAEAQEATAEAQIEEARAKLRITEANLSKAVIRSPIDGVVLDRKVEPGQTVAASLQSPVLFTLAETLTQMELHVDVDEADVGQVLKGQRATFTVDAYPERLFEAYITEVRYAPKTSEGVVTYEALLAVDNIDMFLRPGMTATAEIKVKQVKDALLVPNAALRFTPPVPEKRSQNGGFISRLFSRRPRTGTQRRDETAKGNAGQRVWVQAEGRPKPVPVTVGASDGRMSEVLSGDIAPGQPLIVDIERSGG